MEGLKDDANTFPAERCELFFIACRQVDTVDPYMTRVGRSRPAMTIINVDLPDPEGPTTPTVSPACTDKRHASQDIHLTGQTRQGQMDVLQ